MHCSFRKLVPVSLLLLSMAGTVHAQVAAYAITSNALGVQQLVRFSPSSPGSVQAIGATGVTLTGIDFRPATNVLYGYDGSILYTVDVNTGAATVAFDVNDASGNVGFDFNPVVDRIRVVSAAGGNMRLNQLTGATTVDGAYTFAPGDANFGVMPSFTAVAYTNSDNDPATGTTLYGIDVGLGQLISITNPNGGNISTVGSLGLGALSAITGFDIFTQGPLNTAYFAATSVGSTSSRLYTINLGTGAASLVGDIGTASVIGGLALTTVPEPGTWALLAFGLTAVGAATRRRRA